MQLVLSKLLLYGLIVPQRRSSVNYAILGFVLRQICECDLCSDEGFVHKLCAEAEAGDEVISGSEDNLTDKTAGGLEYRYFEYDENGTPGHTYVYSFEGTTYTISFVSNFDMTSLEYAFLSNVRFEKK